MRIYIEDVFKKKAGKVEVNGWIHEQRDLGKIRFLLIKDMTGIIQITAHKDKASKEVFDLMDKLSCESVISVRGMVKESKQAPGGKEVVPEKIEVLAEAEERLPVDVSNFSKTELPKRLDAF
jgi:aspartyl/asparaginyl-tRNA synthetase